MFCQRINFVLHRSRSFDMHNALTHIYYHESTAKQTEKKKTAQKEEEQMIRKKWLHWQTNDVRVCVDNNFWKIFVCITAMNIGKQMVKTENIIYRNCVLLKLFCICMRLRVNKSINYYIQSMSLSSCIYFCNLNIFHVNVKWLSFLYFQFLFGEIMKN